jgi:hypothetical protein
MLIGAVITPGDELHLRRWRLNGSLLLVLFSRSDVFDPWDVQMRFIKQDGYIKNPDS